MKILVVVDMQNDFIDGSLGTPEAQKIIPNVVEKIRNWDGGIICTLDTHEDDYLSTQEGKKLPVPHCIYSTDGWNINEQVSNIFRTHSTKCDDLHHATLIKDTFGCNTIIDVLATYSEDEEIEAITLVGLCTDICVISNALLIKAFFPEIPISVDASCCAGVTPESHSNALEAMKMCQIDIENE